MWKGRERRTATSVFCASGNVSQIAQNGVQAPENSDIQSAVMVQRWLRCGGEDSVDLVTL